MNSVRKIFLSLAGVVLVSASITCTWMTFPSVANEIPAIGCDDLFNRLHPEWHWKPAKPWPPCFGLCPSSLL